jgi:two-component system phosphate regulon sensor histidine kinase PhoR
MKIDAEKMELDKSKILLNDLVSECISELELQIAENQLEVQTSIPGEKFVFVDPFRIKQVFLNLLSNAIKFSFKRGKIEISLKEDNEEYTISIIDQGIGLKKEDLEKLFGKFVMVNKNIEKFSKGSGLGLYIAKGIVEAHGGKIEANSDGLNKGSEFRFSLPKI